MAVIVGHCVNPSWLSRRALMPAYEWVVGTASHTVLPASLVDDIW